MTALEKARKRADEAHKALKRATPENRERLEREAASAAHAEVIAQMNAELEKAAKWKQPREWSTK